MDLVSYSYFSLKKKCRIGYIGSAGRNFEGKICVYHKSSGNKKCNYLVDFFRRINCFGFIFKVLKISFYTSYLGFIIYSNGICGYTIIAEHLHVKSKIFSGNFFMNDTSVIRTGFNMPLKLFGLFSVISNVEVFPYLGGKLVRAAGGGCLMTNIKNHRVLLKLRSGWHMWLSVNCIATLGISSNSKHQFFRYRKAGHVRGIGRRPTVRGVAMNPCDHPHGGGEGRKSARTSACSPWGWLTKGTPSLKKKYQLARKKKFRKLR